MKVVSSLAVGSGPKTFETNEFEHEVPCHLKLPKLIARRDSDCLACSLHAATRNRVSFWSSRPNNLVFLPVASTMASTHNGILRVACNPESLVQQQLLLSQERFYMTISVKAETHVMILHNTRKFVTATPISITHTHTHTWTHHGQQKSYCIDSYCRNWTSEYC